MPHYQDAPLSDYRYPPYTDPASEPEAPMPELVGPDEYRKHAEATIEAANQHLDRLHRQAKQVAVQTRDAECVLAMARHAAEVYDEQQNTAKSVD